MRSAFIRVKGSHGTRPLIVALAFLLLVFGSLPVSSAQHSGTCEASLDPLRCLEISDLTVTGQEDADSGLVEHQVRALITNSGLFERTIRVVFTADVVDSEGNESEAKISSGAYQVPGDAGIAVHTNWTSHSVEQGEVNFRVSAQFESAGSPLHYWKSNETHGWEKPLLALEPSWRSNEALGANETALFALADLTNNGNESKKINVSIAHSGGGWRFTAEPDRTELGPGNTTQIQVEARAPADARDESGVMALVFVKQNGDPWASAWLAIETRSAQSEVDVNETANEAKPNGQWALLKGGAADGLGGTMVPDHQSGEVPDRPHLPDMPDTPGMPSDPRNKSAEEWAWYAYEKAEETYGGAVQYWPGHALESGGNVVGGRGISPPHFPELMYDPNDAMRSSSSVPFSMARSMIMGPTEPVQSGKVSPGASHAESFEAVFPIGVARNSPGGESGIGGEGTSEASGPHGENSRPSSTQDGNAGERSPLSMNAVDILSTPFSPIVATALLVGLGGGAIVGTAVARPESFLARLFSRIFPGIGFAKLFSRTTGPAVLKHPLRSQIHDVISREPGITISVLVSSMGINRSTLRDHLRTLEREELVQSQSKGRACHYYIKGETSPVAEASAGRDPLFYRHRAKLAMAVLENPGQIQKQLAKAVDLPPSRVCTYTRSLVEAGLIEVKHEGRYRRYFPTDSLHRVGENNLSLA